MSSQTEGIKCFADTTYCNNYKCDLYTDVDLKSIDLEFSKDPASHNNLEEPSRVYLVFTFVCPRCSEHKQIKLEVITR